MLKKFGVPIFLILFFIITIPSFYLISSQSITITEKKVVYELPYPGLLPDHPLYFLKNVRDRILIFTKRHPREKAEFFLLLSDKKIHAAHLLSKKSKNTLATKTTFEAEEQAARVPGLLITAKTQGSGPTPEFIEKTRLSNAKHREVMEELLKTIPQGDQQNIEQAIELNEQARKDLTKL